MVRTHVRSMACNAFTVSLAQSALRVCNALTRSAHMNMHLYEMYCMSQSVFHVSVRVMHLHEVHCMPCHVSACTCECIQHTSCKYIARMTCTTYLHVCTYMA